MYKILHILITSFVTGACLSGCSLNPFIVNKRIHPSEEQLATGEESAIDEKEDIELARSSSSEPVAVDENMKGNKSLEAGHSKGQEGVDIIVPQTEQVEVASSSDSSEEGDFHRRIKQLVTQIESAIPQDEKMVKVSIFDFSDFSGKSSLFTRYLSEELISLFSSQPRFEVINSLEQIPFLNAGQTVTSEGMYAGSGQGAGIEADAAVTGTIMDLGDTVRVNARLIARESGVVIAATSILLPKDMVIENLMAQTYESRTSQLPQNDLYIQIDSLVGQIAKNLSQDKKYKVVMLEFTNLNGEISGLSEFLSEEIITRLFNYTNIEIVDGNLIDTFLGRRRQDVPDMQPSLLLPDNQEKDGRINTIIKGIITDLGPRIRLNVRLLNPSTRSIIGVAATDIRKDETMARLLEGKSMAKERHEESPPAVEKEKKTPDIKLVNKNIDPNLYSLSEKIFFKENFQDYESGQPALNWGDGLIVRKTEGNTAFLTSEKDEFLIARQMVLFPQEFSFEFDVKGNTKYWSSFRLKDEEGNEFEITFKLFQDTLYITLPGPKMIKAEVDTNAFNKIKLVKRHNLYELYANDSILLVGTYSKYKKFNSIEIHSAFKHFQFTNFAGIDLKG